MAIFDMIAFGVIAICIIISMIRGVITEVTSLLIWVVAFIVAKMFAVPFADFALTSVQPHAFAVVLGFILLFVAAWVVQHFLRSLLTAAVSAVGLGSINRVLGGVFGAVKGVLVVTLAVLVCSFTDLPQSPDWQQSVSAVYFEMLARLAVPYLPPVIAEQVQYPTL
ncbi:CvpA family protein [Uruburuella testudinis]|uniref:CvpA family protein n=1 Tax=Uruburuella testudinis TaxID=1282863 RepID=A0ABY4DYP3_9NEIS|nr:CvpA family protein [Uruburuella testudinis]UOO83154.1 CvpA family protein [Uruburuella testudinis]